jgi:hypothetical protein
VPQIDADYAAAATMARPVIEERLTGIEGTGTCW